MRQGHHTLRSISDPVYPNQCQELMVTVISRLQHETTDEHYYLKHKPNLYLVSNQIPDDIYHNTCLKVSHTMNTLSKYFQGTNMQS